MFKEKIEEYISAAYPALWIETPEERRVACEIVEAVVSLNEKRKSKKAPEHQFLEWSANGRGLIQLDPAHRFARVLSGGVVSDTEDPQDMLKALASSAGREESRGGVSLGVSVILMRDLPTDLKATEASPMMSFLRAMKDAIRNAEMIGSTIIFLGQRSAIPPEVLNMVQIVEFPLPSRESLQASVQATADQSGVKVTKEEVEKAAEACSGMTEHEAVNAITLALVRGKRSLHIPTIYDEKCQVIKKSGLLEVIDSRLNIQDVGGNDLLVKYLLSEVGMMSQAARDFHIKSPKGVLVDGFGGTGKSLLAKVTGSIFGWPVLRLDIGSLFGSLVGQSEQNLRAVIRIVEAVSPVVLWLDEFEKATSGMGGSNNGDSGVANRMYSQLLNWMQECEKPVYRFATSNNAMILDAPLLRAGRWDEIFGVDFPNEAGRRAIWKIHMAKAGYKSEDPDALDSLVACSENWNGAEIEYAVQKGLRLAFREKTAFGPDHVESVAESIRTSYSRMAKTQIEAQRKWWKDNALPASSEDTKLSSSGVGTKGGRRVV